MLNLRRTTLRTLSQALCLVAALGVFGAQTLDVAHDHALGAEAQCLLCSQGDAPAIAVVITALSADVTAGSAYSSIAVGTPAVAALRTHPPTRAPPHPC